MAENLNRAAGGSDEIMSGMERQSQVHCLPDVKQKRAIVIHVYFAHSYVAISLDI